LLAVFGFQRMWMGGRFRGDVVVVRWMKSNCTGGALFLLRRKRAGEGVAHWSQMEMMALKPRKMETSA